MQFIKALKDKGFYVMVSGPHCGGGEQLSTTSEVERNDLCAYINDALNLKCRAHDIYFFTLFDRVVSQTTLKEITGLYYDSHHLCLPPSKIGNALNDLLNCRICEAFSPIRSPYPAFQHEEIHAECTIVVSDISTGKQAQTFEPRKRLHLKLQFAVGQYMLLIELPF